MKQHEIFFGKVKEAEINMSKSKTCKRQEIARN